MKNNIKEETKLCKDCKFVSAYSYDTIINNYRCMRQVYNEEYIVTGEKYRALSINCMSERRSSSARSYGLNAKFFEPKVE